jgi:hypothetical protein
LFKGLTYRLITSPNPPHRVWLDRNLGASQVCTSVTDTACYGDLYQWGRAKDGFIGNRKVGEFLLVAQWQFYREFAITYSIYGVVVFLTKLKTH